jgi:hypothetical protein
MDYKGEFDVIFERYLYPYKYKYSCPYSEYEVKILNKDINALHHSIIDLAIIQSLWVKIRRYLKPNIGKRILIQEMSRRYSLEAYEWIMSDNFIEYSFRWLCQMTGRDYKKIRKLLNVNQRFMWGHLDKPYKMIKETNCRFYKGVYKKISSRYIQSDGTRLPLFLQGF